VKAATVISVERVRTADSICSRSSVCYCAAKFLFEALQQLSAFLLGAKGTAELCVQLGSNRTVLKEFTNHRTIIFRFSKEMKYGILINNKSVFLLRFLTLKFAKI
jgi:hypothetical protein